MQLLIVLDNNKITTPLERVQAAARLQETFNLHGVEMEIASTMGIVMAELPDGLPEVLNALMAHPDVKTVELAGEKSISPFDGQCVRMPQVLQKALAEKM